MILESLLVPLLHRQQFQGVIINPTHPTAAFADEHPIGRSLRLAGGQPQLTEAPQGLIRLQHAETLACRSLHLQLPQHRLQERPLGGLD